MAYNSRQITKAIYRLKKTLSTKVYLQVHSQDTSVDPKTGLVSQGFFTYPVLKAIALPESSQRRFAYDLAYIAANKNFTYGGEFNEVSTIFLLDGRDLPIVKNLTQQDRIIYNGRIEEIKGIKLSPDNRHYLVGTKTHESYSTVEVLKTGVRTSASL